MKATSKQIFNYIQGVNARTSVISSLGSFVSEMNQQVADNCLSEVIKALKVDTLAYKIATSTTSNFTEKQLWVMAFELERNDIFSEKVATFYDEINRKENAKIEASKAKLAANKEASLDVLAQIKTAGKKLTDYYKWLNDSKNQFRKEFFNKKYSQESVNQFLSK